MTEFSTVLCAIETLLSQKDQVILAIDGHCGAGKTTLALGLAHRFGGEVVHMDDFFLRPEQRNVARLAEVGGNLDRERFQKELLLPLLEGEPFFYRPFDCETLVMGNPIPMNRSRFTVVEGCYSMHPEFGRYWDRALFLTISPKEQRSRIGARNPDMLSRFLQQWIPMENAYFEAFSIPDRCDFVMDGSQWDVSAISEY